MGRVRGIACGGSHAVCGGECADAYRAARQSPCCTVHSLPHAARQPMAQQAGPLPAVLGVACTPMPMRIFIVKIVMISVDILAYGGKKCVFSM